MKFRVLLFSLLALTQFATAQETQSSDQLYQEAYENFVKRDYVAASASLDKINPVDQKKADILNLRGAIYKRIGELDNAANAYTDALKINPKDWVPKYNLAEVNFLREQYKSSRTFLEQALASMPEADRLQKQDLILYKVYLTYLLQGDEEKAKLLLESFDINSSNPVYYFAQAAWSFKKKDIEKAKTWVASTDELYSQDLRNSYGQALVDIGWMEPSVGVGTTALAANAAPSVTPDATTPNPSPTPLEMTVVPLATDNATPIAVTEQTATPEPTVEVVANPSATIADPRVAVAETPASSKTGFPLKTALLILGVLAVAFLLLMNLAKRSRIVPPPEDNTGYGAISKSGSADAVGTSSYSSEGTGIVLEQDAEGEIVPAQIKVIPISRDYAESDSVVANPRKSAKRPLTKTAPEPAVSIKPRLQANPAKVQAKPVPAKETAPAPKKKSRTPVTKSTPPVAPAPVPAPILLPVPPISLPVPPKAPARTSARKPVEAARRTRLIPVETVVVPAPAVAQPKLLASNIATIKASEIIDAPVVEAPVPPAPVLSKAAPKAKAPVKKAVKKAPAKKAPAKAPAPRPSAPLITIPEFEDTNITSSTSGGKTQNV